MFKFLVWHALVVAGSCELFKEESGYVLNYAPVYNNYKPRDYQFNYAVSDPHTGDHKSQWEVKINGVVRGSYSLLEPDGTTRIVEYIADDGGFRAVVNKLGTAIHPTGPVAAPIVPLVSQYGAYDGRGVNYAPQQNYAPEIQTAPVLPPAPPLEVLPALSPPNLGALEYTLNTVVGTAQENLGAVNIASIPRIEEVPLAPAAPATNIVGNTVGLDRGSEVPLFQSNIGSLDGELNRVSEVPLPRNEPIQLGQIENVAPLLQQFNLEAGYGRLRDVPPEGLVGLPQGYLNNVQLSTRDEVPIINGHLSRVGLAELPPVPRTQGVETFSVPLQDQSLGRYRPTELPQPQIEILGQQGEVPPQAPVPGLVPIDPSYRTIIQYPGQINDNRLKKDVYHSSYSEKVLKVVPSPSKPPKKTKKDFLIYYPESETH